jgi:hypothetical protein
MSEKQGCKKFFRPKKGFLGRKNGGFPERDACKKGVFCKSAQKTEESSAESLLIKYTFLLTVRAKDFIIQVK